MARITNESAYYLDEFTDTTETTLGNYSNKGVLPNRNTTGFDFWGNPLNTDKCYESPNHYNNEKGSIYKFCADQELNPWEFDIIKRIVRCRRKGQFASDLEKTKMAIDLYLTEYNG